MGSSWFTHSLSPSSSPSLNSSQSVLPYSFPRNGRKNRTAKACMHRDSPTDSVFLKRRAILFLGISVVPFLQLKATKALEGQFGYFLDSFPDSVVGIYREIKLPSFCLKLMNLMRWVLFLLY